MTWIGEIQPGNKTIYVVFDEESEFSGPRSPKLSPDQVFEESVPYENVFFNLFFLLLSFCLSVHRVIQAHGDGRAGAGLCSSDSHGADPSQVLRCPLPGGLKK